MGVTLAACLQGLQHKYSTHHGLFTFFLMFGRTARMPIDLVYGTNNPNSQNVHWFVKDMANVLENAYRHVRLTMGLKQEHQKNYMIRRGMRTPTIWVIWCGSISP